MDKPKDLPVELWAAERAFVHRRRTGEQRPFTREEQQRASGELNATDNMVGLALSGGGIRSATISLGVLQALAKHKRLRFIDYLSTVSGGGYMGTFLGGLFTRSDTLSVPSTAEPEQPAPVHPWPRIEAVLEHPQSRPLDWLRENGRFLAPNGAGDLALAFAVVARNMIAVQLVISVLFLLLLLVVVGLRCAVTTGFAALSRVDGSGLATDVNTWARSVLVHEHVWLSPILFGAVLTLLLWVLPTGIAYWLLPSDERDGEREGLKGGSSSSADGTAPGDWPSAWVAIVLLVAAGAAASYVALREREFSPNEHVVVHVMLAFALLLVALLSALWRLLALIPRSDASKVSGFEARNWMTSALRNALLVTVALLVLGLIDSLGQTIHVVFDEPGGVTRWLAGGVSALALVATWAQRIAGALGDQTQKRLKLPVEMIANVLGVGLLLAILVGLATFAHDMTWAKKPAPERSAEPPTVAYQISAPCCGSIKVEQPPSSEQYCHDAGGARVLCVPHEIDWWRYLIALGSVVLLTLIFHRTYSFVNRSSLAALYGARLARAYLGASNAKRIEAANHDLTRLLPGDDFDLRDYQPQLNGGPLPIINVTLNETIAGRSQVEQRDRKGLNMAIGPAGVSVGVRHHAAWTAKDEAAQAKPDDRPPRPGHLLATEEPAAGFRVFPRDVVVKPRWPTVGRWTAISGAAVSTGLGARTTLGLSLLIGLLNFRLGHWFRSGIDPQTRKDKAQSGSSLGRTAARFARALPVQAHLLNELFARFPGTSGEDWYLTDGGHFENSAAYELIRRRLPLIIVCDNGADVDRCFDDLGNLVRKARSDFGANIVFLSSQEIADTGHPDVLGSLAELGFCGRLAETLAAAPNPTPPAPDSKRNATRYAALARITYQDAPNARSLLLILRPAVIGHEPLDVLNYQVANPAFPQQSTGDQFFDEAQWEAYRRLGEYMTSEVLKGLDRGSAVPTDPRDGWRPIDPDKVGFSPRA